MVKSFSKQIIHVPFLLIAFSKAAAVLTIDADVTVSDVVCGALGDAAAEAEGDGLTVVTGDGLIDAFGDVLACGAGVVQPASTAISRTIHKLTASNKDLTFTKILLTNLELCFIQIITKKVENNVCTHTLLYNQYFELKTAHITKLHSLN